MKKKQESNVVYLQAQAAKEARIIAEHSLKISKKNTKKVPKQPGKNAVHGFLNLHNGTKVQGLAHSLNLIEDSEAREILMHAIHTMLNYSKSVNIPYLAI